MDRVIETEQDRDMLVKLIGSQSLPITVSITKGKHRTTAQNRLQRQWVNDLAAQLPDYDAEGWRGYCKLHFGVPILRNENAVFAEAYDRDVRPLPYELKLKLMMVPHDLAVTRNMTTRQLTHYLDAIQKHFAEQGVILTDPDGLLSPKQRVAA